ncbi:hypothetical protein ACFL01_02940, partial [Planctomycetota bacterium]
MKTDGCARVMCGGVAIVLALCVVSGCSDSSGGNAEKGKGKGMEKKQEFEKDMIKTSAGDLEITFLGHGTLMLTFGGKV